MENTGIPFHAYKGDMPYIFVSYAHLDSDLVFPIIQKIHGEGYPIWYDEGIDPGNEWPVEIEQALKSCYLFLVFISPNSVKSINVRNEINLALGRKLRFLAIHLDETELIEGLELQMGSRQAIMKYRMADESFYYKCFTTLAQMDFAKRTQTPSLESKLSIDDDSDNNTQKGPAPKQRLFAKMPRRAILTTVAAIALLLVVVAALFLIKPDVPQIANSGSGDAAIQQASGNEAPPLAENAPQSTAGSSSSPEQPAGTPFATQTQPSATNNETTAPLTGREIDTYNASWIVQDEEWLYLEWQEQLCKIRPDGTEKSILTENTPSHIWLMNNNVYFTNVSRNYAIYVINKDGTGREQFGRLFTTQVVLSPSGVYTHFSVYMAPNARNHFVPWDELETFDDHYSDDMVYLGRDFCVYDNWAYYPSYNHGDELFKYNFDSEPIRVAENKSSCVRETGGRIYYINEDDSNSIYSINPDGTARKREVDAYLYEFFAYEGSIYYMSGYWIYKYDVQSESTIQLVRIDEDCFLSHYAMMNLAVLGDWVYFKYHRWEDNIKREWLARVRTDGTNMEILLEN